MSFENILPTRFHDCQPWTYVIPLRVLFEAKDVEDVYDNIKEEDKKIVSHAQYSDFHSFVPLINGDISTIELLDAIDKGLATFDCMFLFHSNQKEVGTVVTNGIYSSYNICKELVQNLELEPSTKDFFKKVNNFIDDYNDTTVVSQLYIMLIRTLYYAIIYNIAITGITMEKFIFKESFSETSKFEQNLDFLCMRFYQCIIRIQIAYKNNQDNLSSLYTEFKIVHSLIIKESRLQKLPTHLLSNDDESVPFLYLLNDYVFALVKDKLKFEPQLTLFSGKFVKHYQNNVVSILKNEIKKEDYIKQTLLDYLIKCYSHLYENFFSSLYTDSFINFISKVVNKYNENDSIIRKLLSDNPRDQDAAFIAIINYDDKEKGSWATWTWRSITNQNYTVNWAPFLYLQCDLVRYFMNLSPSDKKTSGIVIGEALALQMKAFTEEEMLMDCEVKVENGNIKYWYLTPEKIMIYDAKETKKMFLRRIDGKVFQHTKNEVIEITSENETKKKLIDYNKKIDILINELKMFSSFETIFSIEKKDRIITLKNTELVLEVLEVSEERKKGKIQLLFGKGKKWDIERLVVCDSTDCNKAALVNGKQTLDNNFLFKLKLQDEIMYLMIFTPIINYTSVPETLVKTIGGKINEHNLKFSNTLNWKQLFINSKNGSTSLPGKKTGNIIFKDPSELLLNPYAFHRFIKYSFLYFFDKDYSLTFGSNNENKQKQIFNQSTHLQLWYLYMRNTGIQFQACVDDFKETLSNKTMSDEEKTFLKIIKDKYFCQAFYKKLFGEEKTFLYEQSKYMSLIPPMFNNSSFNSNKFINKIYGYGSNFYDTEKNKQEKSERENNLKLIIKTLLLISGKKSDERVTLQISKLAQIYTGIENEKKVVYDLPMGFGKTSSLLPCLIYISYLKNFKKVAIVVPFNLVHVVRSQLMLFKIYFNNIFELSQTLEEQYKTENELLKCVVCSDYDYKSFITDNASTKNLYDLVIVDEVDSLFDNLKSDFFKSNSFQYLTNIYDKVSAMDTLYTLLLTNYQLDEKHKTLKLPDIKAYNEFIDNQAILSPYRKYPWFVKFPHILYEVNKSMKYGLNYGLAKDNKRFFAVPYLTAKVPSPNNQFSTPDMVLILTYISYMNCPKEDRESYEPIIRRYNQNCSTKDMFNRSKHPGEKIDVNKDYLTDLFEKKKRAVFKIVIYVFQSNFQYAASMTYTSMIDATSSTYTKLLVGFSGTITLTDPFTETQITTMIKYQDTNMETLEFETFKYDQESGYPNCITKQSRIYNNQLCFLKKIKILDSKTKVPYGNNIIYLDIGDVFLYTPENDIQTKIMSDCLSSTNTKNYQFLKFHNGKISKTVEQQDSIIYFYDHANCRGTDYNFDNGEYSIIVSISLRQGTTDNYFSEFLQALYRVRKLHTYFDDENDNFKTDKIAITSIFIYCNTNDDLPSDTEKVIKTLIDKEEEYFEIRKSYAKVQYKRYLEHVCEKFTVKQDTFLESQCNLKPLSKFSLDINDIGNLNAQSSTNTDVDYENKNQLQTQNDLEIRKSGDKRCFEIAEDENEQNKLEKTFFDPMDHAFKYIFVESKRDKKKLRLQNSDIAYFYMQDKRDQKYTNVFMLPIVFKRSNRFKNYNVYNMFGKPIFPSKSVLSSLHTPVYIRLINNLIPYNITKSIMVDILKSNYMFEKIFQIDYLYPFNMITYPKKEGDTNVYDLNTRNIMGINESVYPFPPLKRKVKKVKDGIGFRYYDADIEKDIEFDSKKYKYFQYTTNIKSMDIQFIASENKEVYFEAVNYFFERNKEKATFESNLDRVKIDYATSKCILEINNEDTSCNNNGGIEDKLNCQSKTFSKLFKGNIFELDGKDMTHETFTQMEWDFVMQIKRDKINISKFATDLLYFLIGGYNALPEVIEKIDCSKIDTITITDVIKCIRENSILNSLKIKIEYIFQSIMKNVEQIGEIDNSNSKLVDIKTLVKELKQIQQKEVFYERTIIIFIYRYQIYKKFNSLFEAVKKYIDEEDFLSLDTFLFVKSIYEKGFTSNFFDDDNARITKSEIDCILKTPLFTKLFEQFKDNIESLRNFLEDNNICSKLRNLILNKLIDERWKLTCKKVADLYNSLANLTRDQNEFADPLKQLEQEYFKDLNFKLFTEKFDTSNKINSYEQHEHLRFSDKIKKNVKDKEKHFQENFPNISNYLIQCEINDMRKLLYVILSFGIPPPPSSSSSPPSSSSSFNDKNNNINYQSIAPFAAIGLGTASLLGLKHANKKYKLSQKAKDYFFSRWSKKKEMPVEKEYEVVKKKYVVPSHNSKRTPVERPLKSTKGVNSRAPPKKTATQKPSGQKRSRRKLVEQ